MPKKQLTDYCPVCSKCVRNNQRGIQCEVCLFWHHAKCIGMNDLQYNCLSLTNESWFCSKCLHSILPFSSVDDDIFKNLFSSHCRIAEDNNSKFMQKDNYLFSKARFISMLCNKCERNVDEQDSFDFPTTCKYYDVDELNSDKIVQSMCSNVSCLCFNCRSVPANFDQLSNFLLGLKYKVDIIALTETWMLDAVADSYVIDGYSILYKQRSHGKAGGICVYVKETYVANIVKLNFETDQFEHIEILVNSKDIKTSVTLSVIYRPPQNSVKMFLDLLPNYLELFNQYHSQSSTALICGDFNIDLLRVDSNPNVSSFVDIMYSYSFFPQIHWPTRVTRHSATLIDNIFCNNPDTPNSGVILTDISDHFPAFSTFDLKLNLKLNDIKPAQLRRIYCSKGLSKFNEILTNIEWDFITEQSDLNKDYNEFLLKFRDNFNFCLPLQHIKHKVILRQPWMTGGLLKSSQQKNNLYKQYILGKVDLETYKSFRNKFNNLVRIAKKEYYNNFVNSHKKNSKAMWSLINSQNGRSDKKKIEFDNFSVNDINKFFAELGKNATNNIKPVNSYKNYLPPSNCNSLFLNPITETELINTVKIMPPKLSCGFDEIPMKVIKNVINSVSAPLTKIFNKSLSTGCFPNLLKIAKVCPIFKQGDVADLKNYRPISLLPSFAKILEKLMHARLLSFLQSNNILNSSQHGFQPKKSTSSAIADALYTITSALDKKLLSIALFIDVSKAFDSLNHGILLNKLEHYGVRGYVLNWFSSYLTNRFQYTESNNVCSSYALLVSGVPQGSVLGPLLYLIYVNDIFYVSNVIKTVLYADDTVLIASSFNIASLITLATTYFTLYSLWFSDNLLALNANKTNFMLFAPHSVAVTCPNILHFDVHDVKRVNFVRYLGLIIDSDLTWKQHAQCVSDRIAKGVALIKKCSHFMPSECLIQMYYAFIYCYLYYGIEFWGVACKKYLNPILVLQKRAIRLIAHASTDEHCLPIASTLGILMLDDIYKYCILCLMFRVFHNECPVVFHDMFTKLTSTSHYNTRLKSANFFVHPCKTNFKKYFISHQGVMYWNALSLQFKECTSFKSFKWLLKCDIFVSYV